MNLFNKILSIASIRTPKPVIQGFNNSFQEAKNIEWSRNKGLYEVIFYHQGREKIALFDNNGTLLEYRINLPLDAISQTVRNSAGKEGEIMNCIELHSVDNIRFEFIVRDENLVRYLLITDINGDKIKKEAL